GLVLTPGLVDAHIQLDKAFLSERAPSVEGTVAEALRVTAEAKRRFTVDDIRARATRAGPDRARRHHRHAEPRGDRSHRGSEGPGGSHRAQAGVRAGHRPPALRLRAGRHTPVA